MKLCIVLIQVGICIVLLTGTTTARTTTDPTPPIDFPEEHTDATTAAGQERTPKTNRTTTVGMKPTEAASEYDATTAAGQERTTKTNRTTTVGMKTTKAAAYATSVRSGETTASNCKTETTTKSGSVVFMPTQFVCLVGCMIVTLTK